MHTISINLQGIILNFFKAKRLDTIWFHLYKIFERVKLRNEEQISSSPILTTVVKTYNKIVYN